MLHFQSIFRPPSGLQSVAALTRLEPPDRELLCQASVQEDEFDLDVLETVRRRMGFQERAAQRQLPLLQNLVGFSRP